MDNNICPCCSKNCDLSAPGCMRGEEYKRTGFAPQSDEHARSHENGKGCGHHHHHHMHHRFEHYEDLATPEKLVLMTTKLGRSIHHAFEGKSGQNRVLRILSSEGSLTQRELTERLDIQPGSASEIIKKLETAGLISRSPSEQDRRTVDVVLTETGKAQAAENEVQRKTRITEIFSALSSDEQNTLLALMERLDADWSVRYRPTHGRRHGHKHHRHQESTEYDS